MTSPTRRDFPPKQEPWIKATALQDSLIRPTSSQQAVIPVTTLLSGENQQLIWRGDPQAPSPSNVGSYFLGLPKLGPGQGDREEKTQQQIQVLLA